MIIEIRCLPWITIVAVFVAAFLPLITLAQGCAMCKSAAAAQSEAAAKSLNWGILLLLVPPVTIMSSHSGFRLSLPGHSPPTDRRVLFQQGASLCALGPTNRLPPFTGVNRDPVIDIQNLSLTYASGSELKLSTGDFLGKGWRDLSAAGSQWQWQDVAVPHSDFSDAAHLRQRACLWEGSVEFRRDRAAICRRGVPVPEFGPKADSQ